MALLTVWNYCVPLAIITVACLVRTGKKTPTDRGVNECDVNEKSVKLWLFFCRASLPEKCSEKKCSVTPSGEAARGENTCRSATLQPSCGPLLLVGDWKKALCASLGSIPAPFGV